MTILKNLAPKELEPTADKVTVIESEANQQTGVAGFGINTIKLTDRRSGETIAYIGKLNEEDKIHFTKSLSIEQALAVLELISKKKFNRYMSTERFEKAQEFANRKFS